MIRIQSLSGEGGQNGVGGGQNAPVSLRAAAICYQYHIIKCYILLCKSKKKNVNKAKFCRLFCTIAKKSVPLHSFLINNVTFEDENIE
jgi:hypothetical protein